MFLDAQRVAESKQGTVSLLKRKPFYVFLWCCARSHRRKLFRMEELAEEA